MPTMGCAFPCIPLRKQSEHRYINPPPQGLAGAGAEIRPRQRQRGAPRFPAASAMSGPACIASSIVQDLSRIISAQCVAV